MKKTKALDERERELVVSAMDVVKWVIRTRIYIDAGNINLDYDDLFQEGCIALCKAAATYDGSTKFDTYAKAVIRNELTSYCRKVSSRQKKISLVSLDSVAADGWDNNFANIEKIAAPDGHLDNSAVIELLETVKADYTGTAHRGIEALELKIKGYSGTEIAEMYGVKPNLVGAWISRASQKLRQNERFTDELKDIA